MAVSGQKIRRKGKEKEEGEEKKEEMVEKVKKFAMKRTEKGSDRAHTHALLALLYVLSYHCPIPLVP